MKNSLKLIDKILLIIFAFYCSPAVATTITLYDYGYINFENDVAAVDKYDWVRENNIVIPSAINDFTYIYINYNNQPGIQYVTNQNRKKYQLVEAIPLRYEGSDLIQDENYSVIKSSPIYYDITVDEGTRRLTTDRVAFYSKANQRWLIVLKRISNTTDSSEIITTDFIPEKNFTYGIESVSVPDPSYGLDSYGQAYYRLHIENHANHEQYIIQQSIDNKGEYLVSSLDNVDNVSHLVSLFASGAGKSVLKLGSDIKKLGTLQALIHTSLSDISNMGSWVGENVIDHGEFIHRQIIDDDIDIAEELKTKAYETYAGGVWSALFAKVSPIGGYISIGTNVIKIPLAGTHVLVTDSSIEDSNDLQIAKEILYLKYISGMNWSEIYSNFGLVYGQNDFDDLVDHVAEYADIVDTYFGDYNSGKIENIVNGYIAFFDEWALNKSRDYHSYLDDFDSDGINNDVDIAPNNSSLPEEENTVVASFSLDKSTVFINEIITATSSSDSELEHAWTLNKPSGSNATLSYNSDKTTAAFTADLKGSYTLSLEVDNGTTQDSFAKSIVALPEPVDGHNLSINDYSGIGSSISAGSTYCVDIGVGNRGDYAETVKAELTVTGPSLSYSSGEKNLGTIDTSASSIIIKQFDNAICYTMPSSLQDGYFSFLTTVYSDSGDEDWSDNTRVISARYGEADETYAMAYNYIEFDQWSADSAYRDLNLRTHCEEVVSDYGYEYNFTYGSDSYEIYIDEYSIPCVKLPSGVYESKSGYDEGEVYAFDDGNLIVGVETLTDDKLTFYVGHSTTFTNHVPWEIQVNDTHTHTFNLPGKGTDEDGPWEFNLDSSKKKFDLSDSYSDVDLDFDRESHGFDIDITPLTAGTHEIIYQMEYEHPDEGCNNNLCLSWGYFFANTIYATNPPTDSDNDGVLDSADAFPSDPTEQYDSDGDGVGNNTDVFPNDPTEQYDTDGDGVGDNSDAFPNDSAQQHDTDGDGVGDNADVFPNDPTEQYDADGDGVGDNSDAFPNDPSASVDSDDDGYPDSWNAGMGPESSTTGLTIDSCPNDSNDWLDSDGDGVCDSSDEFNGDPFEWVDSDGDGVGDNSDVEANNPDRWANSAPILQDIDESTIKIGEVKQIILQVTEPEGDDYTLSIVNNDSDVSDFVSLNDSTLRIDTTGQLSGDISFFIAAEDSYGGKSLKLVTFVLYEAGDLNGDSNVDLLDMLLSLRVIAGEGVDSNIYLGADVNGDSRLGIEEAIYILRKNAGLISDENKPFLIETFEESQVGSIPVGWINGPWSNAGTIYTTDVAASTGSHSVFVKGLSSNCKGIIRPDSLLEEDMSVSFDINLPSDAPVGTSPTYFMYAGIVVSFHRVDDTSFEARLSHDPTKAIAGLSPDTWHKITLDIDWNNSQVRISTNENTVGPFDFTKNVSKGWASDISLYGNNKGSGNSGYYDNIKVTQSSLITDLFKENFSDGDYTLNPEWTATHANIAPGQIVVTNNALHILRTGAGGSGQSEKLEIEVDIPISSDTQITFDAKPVYRSVRSGCGDSCTEHPANVQLYLDDSSGTEYIVRYAVNYDDAIADVTNGTFKQYATSTTQDTWITGLQYNILEAWPNAERITKIMLFGAGWDFEGYIDNVVISDLYSEVGFADFVITDSTVPYKSDYDNICSEEFGAHWGLADWADLQAYYDSGADMDEFITNLGFENKPNVWVTRNGVQSYSDTRDYFASYHNHNKPSGYLAHDNIDNYFFSLGSWSSGYYVLCKKNGS